VSKGWTDETKDMLRDFINENWKTLFGDVLSNPASVLTNIDPKLAKTALGDLQTEVTVKQVTEEIQTFLKQCNAVCNTLTQVAVAVALSPEALAFVVSPLSSPAYDRKSQDAVGETGNGNLKNVFAIIPNVIKGGKDVKGKSFVYKINA